MRTPAEAPSLARLVLLIAQTVNFTFGGGSTIVGVLRRELVERRGWLSEEEFGTCYAVSRITPGTTIFAFCTITGWFFGRWRGAMLALIASAVPCTLLVVAMLLGYEQAKENFWFQQAVRGAMAAAIGIMLASSWLILRPYLQGPRIGRNVAIFLGSVVLMMGFDLRPVPILALAALAGALFPDRFGA